MPKSLVIIFAGLTIVLITVFQNCGVPVAPRTEKSDADKNNTKQRIRLELPDNRSATSWLDMSNNSILFHFNDVKAAGLWQDSSSGLTTASCDSAHCPDESTGIFFTGLSFNGTRFLEVLPNDTNWYESLENSFAISLWIKIRSLPQQKNCNAAAGYNGCVSSPIAFKGRGLFVQPDGKLATQVAVGSNRNVQVFTKEPYAIDQWHHVVFQLDSARKILSLFVNGASAGEMAFTESVTTLKGTPTPRLNIGAAYPKEQGGVQWQNYFDGQVDEVAVFDKPLSPDQVALIFQNQSPQE